MERESTLDKETGVNSNTSSESINQFTISEGTSENYLFQNERVSAHVLLNNGTDKSVVVAFPAGNAGIGLFCTIPGLTSKDTAFTMIHPPEEFPRQETPEDTPKLKGVRFTIRINSQKMEIREFVLDTVRMIRTAKNPEVFLARKRTKQEFLNLFDYPVENFEKPVVQKIDSPGESAYTFRRSTEDRAYTYYCEIRIPEGITTEYSTEGNLELQSQKGEFLTCTITAAVTFPQLTPFTVQELLNDDTQQFQAQLKSAGSPEEARFREYLRAFRFLAYHEKFLAGSWRFLTYFGRDTMMSLMMLRDSLCPKVYESALTSVLERVSPDGRVAHEEDIDSQAIQLCQAECIDLIKKGKKEEAEKRRKNLSAPIYDYTMVDDDFMLSLMFEKYINDAEIPESEKTALLHQKDSRGRSFFDTLLRNINLILKKAEPFTLKRTFENLIRITPGLTVGDWRDSAAGLGWGVYPGSVNVYLVPRAVEAVQSIFRSPGFPREQALDIVRENGLDSLEQALKENDYLENVRTSWMHARNFFQVRFLPDRMREILSTFLESLETSGEQEYYRTRVIDNNITLADFLRGDTPQYLKEGLMFHAISLREDGTPVEVMNSDVGYELFFGNPSSDEIENLLLPINLPYPMGLAQLGGILVANPVYSSDTSLRESLGNKAYHGTVIWAWQHSLILLGLIRQIRRYRDGKNPQLVEKMWKTIENINRMEEACGNLVNSELWNCTIKNGEMKITAYGTEEGSETVSNAVQLWSTVGISVMKNLKEFTVTPMKFLQRHTQ